MGFFFKGSKIQGVTASEEDSEEEHEEASDDDGDANDDDDDGDNDADEDDYEWFFRGAVVLLFSLFGVSMPKGEK